MFGAARKEWEVRPCTWPYPEGYATYNPSTKTVLDTGLSREQAQIICDQLNQRGGSVKNKYLDTMNRCMKFGLLFGLAITIIGVFVGSVGAIIGHEESMFHGIVMILFGWLVGVIVGSLLIMLSILWNVLLELGGFLREDVDQVKPVCQTCGRSEAEHPATLISHIEDEMGVPHVAHWKCYTYTSPEEKSSER